MPSVSMAIHNKEKTMKFKTAAAAALAVATILGMGACGSTDSSSGGKTEIVVW